MYQGIIQQPLCRIGVVPTFAKLKTDLLGKTPKSGIATRTARAQRKPLCQALGRSSP